MEQTKELHNQTQETFASMASKATQAEVSPNLNLSSSVLSVLNNKTTISVTTENHTQINGNYTFKCNKPEGTIDFDVIGVCRLRYQILYIVDCIPPDEIEIFLTNELLCDASQCGKFDIIKYMVDRTNKWDYQRALIVAPLSGNLEIVKFFSAKSIEPRTTAVRELKCWPHNVFNNAAAIGRIDILEWLTVNRPQDRVGNRMYQDAAEAGHIHVLDYLRANQDRSNDTYNIYSLYDSAIQNDNLSVFQWLFVNGYKSSFNIMNHVAGRGNLKILKWLHENTKESPTTDAIDTASVNGKLDIIIWLFENRTEGCTNRAITDGSYYTRHWLVQNRPEFKDYHLN
ncbi:hypothetical protein PPL_08876 [Heterostelium album PN500]|uniref:Ankyrin repeat protein n=1 Tax=Heterostelium pallidum (strain ATCC 26659 / Pp 5 / PN500) TaxID=670386 RepID=D3BJZ5_HETP5|nr:hypothetical protein PPL_08876 [Heterostelium album PN500]EFA78225.1 hypothetical protein PPL_08876 [Heterostelium album PN500]|eukprot:XP_020430350.1 hypothetical protein PPL_08876 [Heterostelium album PN500]